MNEDSHSSADPFGCIADEFVEAYRQGKRPSIEEFAHKYPEHADEIREMLPALVMMEQAKSAPGTRVEQVESEDSRLPSQPSLKCLGDYRILREIGRGGMGIVYEAEQISLGRRVALKVLPTGGGQKHRTRFEREARAAARLHHTNIVPVFGVGEQDGVSYYVMQFIPGLGLDIVLDEVRRLRSKGAATPTPGSGGLRVSRRQTDATELARSLVAGPLNWRGKAGAADAKTEHAAELTSDLAAAEAPIAVYSTPEGLTERPSTPDGAPGRLSDEFSVSDSSAKLPSQSGRRHRHHSYAHSIADIGRQVAEALEYAHGQGVLHRDIKPGNLLLDTHGTVWVTDFGLAKAADQDNLTHTGDLLGTLRYMPPEAFEGQADRRGDIYSLGITLYEMLGLRPAFDERERAKLIRQVTNNEIRRLEELSPDVPLDLATIVHKAIERDPQHRYGTAGEFAADLDRFLNDEPILARRLTPVERFVRWARHNRSLAGALSGIALLLVVSTIVSSVAGIYFWRQKTLQAELAAKNAELLQITTKKEEEARLAASEQAKLKNAALAEGERARENYEMARVNYRLARRAVDESLSQIANDPVLSSLGMQPLRKELLRDALEFYDQFLQQQKDDPTLRTDLADALDKVGQITAEIGSPTEALAHYERALALRDELLAADGGREDQLVARSLEREAIGRLQLHLGRLDEATASLQTSYDEWNSRPSAPDAVAIQARILESLANVALMKPDMHLALRRYNSLYRLLEEEVARLDGQPQADQLRLQLARAGSGIASLNVRMGHLQRTFTSAGVDLTPADLLSQSRASLETLERKLSDGPLRNEVRRELAATFEKLATYHQARQALLPAVEAQRLARPLREQLADSNQLVSEFRAELAENLRGEARLELQNQNAAHATELLEEAIRHQRSALAAAPDAASYVLALARLLADQSGALERTGQAAAALPAMLEAAELCERLPTPGREVLDLTAACHAKVVGLLSTSAGGAAGDAAELRERHADLAIAALRRSLQSGIVDYRLLEKEPAFAILEGRPAYDALKQELEELSRAWQWHEDIDEAARVAAETGKDLLVYFSGSDWCPWCMTVRQSILDREEFLRAATANYVLVLIDLPQFKPRPANDHRNRELRANWGVDSYPSFVFCDAKLRRFASTTLDDADVNQLDSLAQWLDALKTLHQRRVERDATLAAVDAAPAADRPRKLVEAYSGISPAFLQDFGPDANLALLTAKIELAPHDAAAHRARADWYVRRKEWSPALADLLKIVELSPNDSETPILAATACVLAQDRDAWEQLVETLQEQKAVATDPVAAERAAKAILTFPDDERFLSAASTLAERSTTLDTTHWVVPFGWAMRCWAEYRLGHHDAAIAFANQVLAHPERIWFRDMEVLFIKSMAHQRLGQGAEAFDAWRRATEILDEREHWSEFGLHSNWHDWHIGRFLQSESERLLAKNETFVAARQGRAELASVVEWRGLTNMEAKSAAGAVLIMQSDGSVLASGVEPDQDIYTLTAPLDLHGATALRLEVLPDDSLPGGGPGRRDGFFLLTGVRARVLSDGAAPQVLRLIDAASDSRLSRTYEVKNALFPDASSGWAVAPGRAHEAVFVLASDAERDAQARLEVTLEFQGQEDDGKLTLGRFRLSVGYGPFALVAARARWAADQNAVDQLVSMGVARAIQGRHAEAARYFAQSLSEANTESARQEVLKLALPFAGTLAALRELQPDEPRWALASAKRDMDNGQNEQSRRARRAAITLLESRLAAQHQDADAAQLLANALLEEAPSDWSPVEALELTADNKVILTSLEDGSIAASGANPDNSVYQVRFRPTRGDVAAVQVQAISDAGATGPVGRSDNGNFVLTRFMLHADGPVAIAGASADFSQPTFPVAASLDDDPESGWAVLPFPYDSHHASYILAQPVDWTSRTVTARLEFSHSAGKCKTLSRFRLLTTNAEGLRRAELRDAVERNALLGAAAAGAAYAIHGDAKKAAQWFEWAVAEASPEDGALILEHCQRQPEILSLLESRLTNDARLLATVARIKAYDHRDEEASSYRRRARALFEADLRGTIADRTAAGLLAEVLLADRPTKWALLRPGSLSSAGGSQLTPQADGSVLVSGVNPPFDKYTIVAPAEVPMLRGLRLEALPDPTLPGGGSGRSADDGDFALSDVSASIGPPSEPAPTRIQWAAAASDHHVSAADHYANLEMSAANAIDGRPETFWENFPVRSEPLEAVFLAMPIDAPANAELTVELRFQTAPQHGIGKFRLWATDDLRLFGDIWRQRLTGGELPGSTAVALAYLLTGDAQHAASALAVRQQGDQAQAGLDHLVSALVAQQNGRASQAQVALDRATEWLKRNPADEVTLELARHALQSAAKYNAAEAEATLATFRNDAELRRLTVAIERNERNPDLRVERANYHGRRGRWAEAATDLAKAVELRPTDTYIAMQRAIALAKIGDLAALRLALDGMLSRWKQTSAASEAERTAKACLIIPNVLSDLQPLERLAGVGMSLGPDDQYYVWRVLAKSLVDYRAGRFGEVVAKTEEILPHAGNGAIIVAPLQALQAMAKYRSGDVVGARIAYQEAERLFDEQFPRLPEQDLGNSWHDWVVAELLLEEARATVLVQHQSEPVPSR